MKYILFVDDEQSVLDSIARILFDIEEDWHIEYANSADEALQIMAKKPFDIIISDMRMPYVNGAELLREVKRLYPYTIRFILSGYSDKDMILKTVEAADQFLVKPCNHNELINAIRLALDAHKIISNEVGRVITSDLNSLPTLPNMYYELRTLIDSPNSDIKEIARLIECDITVSAKVLQLVNSAFFGLRKRIESIEKAIVYLGLDTLKALVIYKNVFTFFEKDIVDKFNLEGIYKHSYIAGDIARGIMRTITNDKRIIEEAYISALLHDIGKIVLIDNKVTIYNMLYQKSNYSKIPLYKLEQETLGITHADIGAYLMCKWGFEDSVVSAINNHHSLEYIDSDNIEIKDIVFVANLLATNEIYTMHFDLNTEEYFRKYLNANGKLMDKLQSWIKLSLDLREGSTYGK